MIEETAVRVEISAARFASQSIFDILRLTVQAMSSQNYGQQSLSALNRQERPLASVDVNEKNAALHPQAAEAIFRRFFCHKRPRHRSDVFVV